MSEERAKLYLHQRRQSKDVIAVERAYVDMCGGDLTAGVFLGQVVYWHEPDRNGESKLKVEKDGFQWIAKKREDWWEECRISPKQFDRVCAIAEQLGLIVSATYRFNGSPVKHIRLDLDGFFRAWDYVTSTGKIFDVDVLTQLDSVNRGENGNSPKGKIEIPQTGRWKSTKGEDPLYIETTTENTSETTNNNTLTATTANAVVSHPKQPVQKGSVKEVDQLSLLAVETTDQETPSKKSEGTVLVKGRKGKKPVIPKNCHLTEEDFEKFWSLVPFKKGKDAAQTAFFSNVPKSVSISLLMEMYEACMAGYKEEKGPKFPAIGWQFFPRASTWLNSNPWKDEATHEMVERLRQAKERQAYLESYGSPDPEYYESKPSLSGYFQSLDSETREKIKEAIALGKAKGEEEFKQRNSA